MCPKCRSNDLARINHDDFEREAKWLCNNCGKQFTTNSSDDSTDYSVNK